jgi:hypothetical protein
MQIIFQFGIEIECHYENGKAKSTALSNTWMSSICKMGRGERAINASDNSTHPNKVCQIL